MKNDEYIARIVEEDRQSDMHGYLWEEDPLYDSFAAAYYKFMEEDMLHLKYPNISVIARAAILCLTMHKDCGYMLDSDLNEIKLLVKLGDERAILLYPACIMMNLLA